MFGRYPIATAYYGRGPATFELGITLDICHTTVVPLHVRRVANIAPPVRTAESLNTRAAQAYCEE